MLAAACQLILCVCVRARMRAHVCMCACMCVGGCFFFFFKCSGRGEDCRTGKRMGGRRGVRGGKTASESTQEMQKGEERRKLAIDSVLKPPTNNSH